MDSRGSLKVDGRLSDLPFKTAPHILEAEQALLGAIICENEALDRVSDFLEAKHFYDPLHEQIYALLHEVITAGKVANPITLRPHVESWEPIDNVKKVSVYLGELGANATTTINARDYARTVHNLYTRRQLIVIGEDIVNAAYDTPSVDFDAPQQREEAETRDRRLPLPASIAPGRGRSRRTAPMSTSRCSRS